MSREVVSLFINIWIKATKKTKGQNLSSPVLDFCKIFLLQRAMAAHDADYVEPSAELGKDWLEMEARRNCRWWISCVCILCVRAHASAYA